MEVRVVDVFPDERQKIPQAVLNVRNLIAVIWEPIGKIAYALPVKGGIVDDDQPAAAQNVAERANEILAAVAVIIRKEFKMFEGLSW